MTATATAKQTTSRNAYPAAGRPRSYSASWTNDRGRPAPDVARLIPPAYYLALAHAVVRQAAHDHALDRLAPLWHRWAEFVASHLDA